jgi:hypothetical protein
MRMAKVPLEGPLALGGDWRASDVQYASGEALSLRASQQADENGEGSRGASPSFARAIYQNVWRCTRNVARLPKRPGRGKNGIDGARSCLRL